MIRTDGVSGDLHSTTSDTLPRAGWKWRDSGLASPPCQAPCRHCVSAPATSGNGDTACDDRCGSPPLSAPPLPAGEDLAGLLSGLISRPAKGRGPVSGERDAQDLVDRGDALQDLGETVLPERL